MTVKLYVEMEHIKIKRSLDWVLCLVHRFGIRTVVHYTLSVCKF